MLGCLSNRNVDASGGLGRGLFSLSCRCGNSFGNRILLLLCESGDTSRAPLPLHHDIQCIQKGVGPLIPGLAPFACPWLVIRMGCLSPYHSCSPFLERRLGNQPRHQPRIPGKAASDAAPAWLAVPSTSREICLPHK